MQIGEDVGSGTKQDGVAGLKGCVSDILDHHGFAQAIGAHEDEVAGFRDEVQGESPFDGGAIDFLGPVPIEVGHRAEAADASHAQTTFQGAARAFSDFSAGEFFQDQLRRPTGLDGARQEIIQGVSGGVKAELEQLG